MNPFIAIEDPQHLEALRTLIAILKGKVRSERGANRATSKAKQANSMVRYSVLARLRQLLVFLILRLDKKLCLAIPFTRSALFLAGRSSRSIAVQADPAQAFCRTFLLGLMPRFKVSRF
jgi:hypothetical protein